MQAIKKRKSELVNEAGNFVKELKQIEVAAKQNSGRTFREVIGKVEDIFKNIILRSLIIMGASIMEKQCAHL